MMSQAHDDVKGYHIKLMAFPLRQQYRKAAVAITCKSVPDIMAAAAVGKARWQLSRKLRFKHVLTYLPGLFTVKETHAQEADWIKTRPSAGVLSLLDKEPEIITIIVALEQLGSATARKAGRKRRAALIVHQRHVSWRRPWPAASPTGEQLDLGVIFRCLKHNHLVREQNALCNRYKKTSSGMIFVHLDTSAHEAWLTLQQFHGTLMQFSSFRRFWLNHHIVSDYERKFASLLESFSKKPGDRKHHSE